MCSQVVTGKPPAPPFHWEATSATIPEVTLSLHGSPLLFVVVVKPSSRRLLGELRAG